MENMQYFVWAAVVAIPVFILCKLLKGRGGGSAQSVGGVKIRDVDDLADAIEERKVTIPPVLRAVFRDLGKRLEAMDVAEESEGDMASIIYALERIVARK